MRINLALAAEGNSSALEFFGDVGTDGYKWLLDLLGGVFLWGDPQKAGFPVGSPFEPHKRRHPPKTDIFLIHPETDCFWNRL